MVEYVCAAKHLCGVPTMKIPRMMNKPDGNRGAWTNHLRKEPAITPSINAPKDTGNQIRLKIVGSMGQGKHSTLSSTANLFTR